MTEEVKDVETLPNLSDDVIIACHRRMSEIEAEEEKAKGALKAIRDRKKNTRNEFKGYGITLGVFDQARKDLLKDEDEVRAELAERGRYLTAMKSPLGHQFDLFADTDKTPQDDRWFSQGFNAYLRGEAIEDNPHKPGDEGRAHWERGFQACHNQNVMGLQALAGPSDEDAGEEDAEPTSELEEAMEEADAAAEAAEGAPVDEDAANDAAEEPAAA
ncbi:hypothetical protein [Maricaulis sp. MIT060901]|uniref:hypothetical protein n=1 Tax=Maricaulis sp. MIT060901 TaxID=3096993 RepID=UPI00399B44EB